MKRSPSILFLGTPHFAAIHLETLVKSGHRVVGVCTQPDQVSGRGSRLRPTPVKEMALKLGLPVFQPANMHEEGWHVLESLRPDLGVVVAFGQILRKKVLSFPPLGLINVHASLLPRYRGAAPIERAIQNGDEETGITIIRLVRAMDAGAMGWRQSLRIHPWENYGRLTARLAKLGCRSLLDFLNAQSQNKVSWTTQDEDQVTYAHKVEKPELQIDWEQPASVIQRQIRAFDPHQKAWCMLKGQRVKLLEARGFDDSRAEAAMGCVIGISHFGAWIQAGRGCLCVSEIQFPSKRPASFMNARNGRLIREGDILR